MLIRKRHGIIDSAILPNLHTSIRFSWRSWRLGGEHALSILTVNNIEKSFGGDTILSGVGFRLAWGQKLGLVGRNGSGKTTLLRILTNQMEPDRGSVNYAKGI